MVSNRKSFLFGGLSALVIMAGLFAIQYSTGTLKTLPSTDALSNNTDATNNVTSTSTSKPTNSSFTNSTANLKSGAGAKSTKGLDPQDAQAVKYADDFYTLLKKGNFKGLTQYVSNSIPNKQRVSEMYRNLFANNNITLKSFNVFTIDNTLSTSTMKVLLVHLDEISNGKDYKYTRKIEMSKDSDGKWRVSAVKPYTH